MPDSCTGCMYIYRQPRECLERHIGNLARLLRPILYGSMQSSQQPHTIPPLILLLVRECNPSSLCESSPPPTLSLFEISGLTSGKAAAKNKLETRSSRLLLYECHNIAATSFHRHYIFLNLARFRLYTPLSTIVLVGISPILPLFSYYLQNCQ